MSIGKKKRWTEEQLKQAAQKSSSIRQVIFHLGLVPAGGNYIHVQKYLRALKINISHFKGKGWNKGLKRIGEFRISLDQALVSNSTYQSYKLKRRLFAAGLKIPKCEECGWAKTTTDGRLPLELDHINGDRMDNRLENLRILCPNCHSLQSTHRSKNRKRKII